MPKIFISAKDDFIAASFKLNLTQLPQQWEICDSIEQAQLIISIDSFIDQDIKTPIIEISNNPSRDDLFMHWSMPVDINSVIAKIISFEQIGNISINENIILNLNDKKLYDSNDNNVNLTQKECAIIKHLYSNQQGSSREDLLENVWGYSSDIDTHTIETHLYRLRQKIENFDVKIISKNNLYFIE